MGPRSFSRYRDWLQAGRSGDRMLEGERFSAPVQTGLGAHPASYTMGTGSFKGVKWPGRGVDRPPHLIIIIIIIIMFIDCKWVDTRWQWSFNMLHMHGLWRLII